MSKVEATVTRIITEYVPEWNGDLDVWKTDWLDSLQYIELVFAISDEFEVDVPLDIEDVRTPRDIVNFIEKELASG